MSYILEALKKAQAERQLGATPDVHAPTIDAYAARQTARPAWLPAALGGAAAVAALGLALWWRQDAPAVVAPQAGAPASAAQPSAAQVSAVQASAAQASAIPAPVVQAPAAQPQAVQPSAARQPAAPLPAQATAAAVAAATARANTPPSVTQPEPKAAAASAPAKPVAQAVQPAQQQAVAAAPAKPAAAPEPQDEYIPAARELPEPIQRILPTVAMSGYMYSRNPADRMVLIDKALRREGDEVAPGLVLERLQPKGAVFTFRGYRYRVPY